MPTRKMSAVEVVVIDHGDVALRQEHDGGEEDIVALHYSQVPLVIEWLQQAADEAEVQAAQDGGA